MAAPSKTLLVTGATGLIGKELAEPLLRAGFDIHATDGMICPPRIRYSGIDDRTDEFRSMHAQAMSMRFFVAAAADGDV